MQIILSSIQIQLSKNKINNDSECHFFLWKIRFTFEKKRKCKEKLRNTQGNIIKLEKKRNLLLLIIIVY